MTLKLKSIALSLATASALALTMTEVRASNKEDDIQKAPQDLSVLRTQPLQGNLPFAEVNGTKGASSLKNTRSKAFSEKKKSKKPSNDFIGSDPRKKIKTNETGNKKEGSGENDINQMMPELKIEAEKQTHPEEQTQLKIEAAEQTQLKIEAEKQTHPEGKEGAKKKSRIPWLQLNLKEFGHKWGKTKHRHYCFEVKKNTNTPESPMTTSDLANKLPREIEKIIKMVTIDNISTLGDTVKSLLIKLYETKADRIIATKQAHNLRKHTRRILPYIKNLKFKGDNPACQSRKKLFELLGQEEQNKFEEVNETKRLQEELDQLRAENAQLKIEMEQLKSMMGDPQLLNPFSFLFALNLPGMTSNPQLQPINGQFPTNLLGMGMNPQPQPNDQPSPFLGQLNFFNMLFNANGSQIQGQQPAVQNQGSLSNAPLIKKEEETQPFQPINGQFPPNLLEMGINDQPSSLLGQLNFFNMLFHANGSQIQGQPAAVQNQGSLSGSLIIKKEEETQP